MALVNSLSRPFSPDDILWLLVVAQQLVDQLRVDCHGCEGILPLFVSAA
jgi:hypothetical protein